jgi:hypothetical protein
MPKLQNQDALSPVPRICNLLKNCYASTNDDAYRINFDNLPILYYDCRIITNKVFP